MLRSLISWLKNGIKYTFHCIKSTSEIMKSASITLADPINNETVENSRSKVIPVPAD